MNNVRNSRLLNIVTLLLLTANFITLVFLWTSGDRKKISRRPPEHGPVFNFLSDQLKFDSAQQVSFKKLREAHKTAAMELQDSIRAGKDAFFALLKQPDVSDSMVRLFGQRIALAVQQLDELTFRHFQQVKALCKPEQKIKFDKIIEEAIQRMAPGRENGGPPPLGPRSNGIFTDPPQAPPPHE